MHMMHNLHITWTYEDISDWHYGPGILDKKSALSQAKPRDAIINLNKQLIISINILFRCLTVTDTEVP